MGNQRFALMFLFLQWNSVSTVRDSSLSCIDTSSFNLSVCWNLWIFVTRIWFIKLYSLGMVFFLGTGHSYTQIFKRIRSLPGRTSWPLLWAVARRGWGCFGRDFPARNLVQHGYAWMYLIAVAPGAPIMLWWEFLPCWWHDGNVHICLSGELLKIQRAHYTTGQTFTSLAEAWRIIQ